MMEPTMEDDMLRQLRDRLPGAPRRPVAPANATQTAGVSADVIMEDPQRDVTRDRRVTEFNQEGLDNLALAFPRLFFGGGASASAIRRKKQNLVPAPQHPRCVAILTREKTGVLAK